MARVSNTLIGPSSGRVGNAVFSTWKGINVLKEKPASVANPNTDNQKMRRSALRQMVIAFRAMPGALRAGFKKLAVGQSEWNAMASYNLKFGFDFTSPPTALLVPADVLTSKGTITSTPISSVVSDDTANTITATFASTIADPGQSLTDRALICAYNITLNEWTGEVTADPRSGGTASITLPDDWVAGNTLRVYLAFSNASSGESSNSVNAANTIV